jgi:hypothetical protein
MQELLDRIKGRNLGKKIEFRGYAGNDPADYKLIQAGHDVLSLFVENQDMKITVYGFNDGREPEIGKDGKYDHTQELDYIIGEIIRLKYA